jgi:hypothetical protein
MCTEDSGHADGKAVNAASSRGGRQRPRGRRDLRGPARRPSRASPDCRIFRNTDSTADSLDGLFLQINTQAFSLTDQNVVLAAIIKLCCCACCAPASRAAGSAASRSAQIHARPQAFEELFAQQHAGICSQPLHLGSHVLHRRCNHRNWPAVLAPAASGRAALARLPAPEPARETPAVFHGPHRFPHLCGLHSHVGPSHSRHAAPPHFQQSFTSVQHHRNELPSGLQRP